MQVEFAAKPLAELEAGLHAVAVFDGEDLPAPYRDAPGAGDVKGSFKKLTLLRPGDGPERLLAVGLGKRQELSAERLRVAAALAAGEAGRYRLDSVGWEVPAGEGAPASAERGAALVEGTILASYRFDRFKSRENDEPQPPRIKRLTLATSEDARADVDAEAEVARVGAEAANRARELEDMPANLLTPTGLAERATEIAAAHGAVTVEVMGRDEIEARGLGGLAAVAAGSAQEPRLVSLRYDGRGGGEKLGLIGKAVTFDSGGISIKPATNMHEMKMDMSGGAVVVETIAAFAELELPLDVVAAVPATENMPSGTATRPGDVITQLNGKTVEITNTDAEGRLILADALTWCVRELEADRVIDLATLTGAVVVALGSTYAALISNDDDLADLIFEAAERSGELAWRLPLHPEYKELTKGTITDLVNSSPKRKAGTIYAASFLEEFVDGKPWAHLDIAGTSWDVGREYVGKGATGCGVRLLVSLARELAESGR
jgi:leucyl aminopeptidase